MAYFAPGQSRRTAWAMTWAVEYRAPRGRRRCPRSRWRPAPRRAAVMPRSTSRPSTLATTAALARRLPMERASSSAVVPSASSRVEPSGRPTEMTPGIVHPFLLSRRIAPGPDAESPGYRTDSPKHDSVPIPVPSRGCSGASRHATFGNAVDHPGGLVGRPRVSPAARARSPGGAHHAVAGAAGCVATAGATVGGATDDADRDHVGMLGHGRGLIRLYGQPLPVALGRIAVTPAAG